MSRFALSLSLCINLLLLTTLVAARVDSSRGDQGAGGLPAAAAWPSSSDARSVAGGAGELQDYYRSLRNRGLTDAETRPLVRVWLEAAWSGPIRAEPQVYWRAEDAAELEAALDRRLRHEASVRAGLLEVYGKGVELEPLFADLFRPLGPGFDFLSPEAQRAVAEWEQRRAIERRFAAGPSQSRPAPCERVPSGSRPRGPVEPPILAALAPLIGEPAAREYALRRSAMAAELRNSGLDFDEDEFRRTFALLRALSDGPSVAEQLELRESLKSLLGEQRYDRFWARRDRDYGRLVTALRPFDLAEHDIAAAYGVINRGRERLLALAQRSRPDAGLVDELRFIRDEQQRRLVGLIGPDASEALAVELDRAEVERFDAAARLC